MTPSEKKRAYNREYFQRPEVKARERERYKTRPQSREKNVFKAIKSRALKEGLPFNLDLKDIIAPKTCPVFGIPLDGSTYNNRPSVDRLIPEKGYVKDNVRVISLKANRLKSNCSVEDLQKLIDYIKQS